MHVGDEDLEMYILESLPLREQSAITSHLGSCATCQGKLVESVRFAGKIAALKQAGEKGGKDQRRFTRIATDMAASIRMLSPASSGRAHARVLDTSRDGLKLRVPEFLHPGATIQVRVTDTVAFGEVRYCQPAGSAFHVGVQIRDSFPAPGAGSIQPKRKEPRSAVSATAGLVAQGRTDPHPVTVLDVSRSGLRVRSGISLATGSRVEIIYGNATVRGEVRYSRELAPDEFNIGINADGIVGNGEVHDADLDLTLLFNLE
ncbi:MAG TPA: PilZ domain-containing protein [Bryobacteraceae bacterium]|nr:PilZ domain-containing protein [Bryobacteraceae bacterium]